MSFQIRNQLLGIIPDDMVNVDKFTICIVYRGTAGLQMQEDSPPANKGLEIPIKPPGFPLSYLIDELPFAPNPFEKWRNQFVFCHKY